MSDKKARLRNWAASVPPLLAYSAINIASSAVDEYYILEELRQRIDSPLLMPLPPVKVWMGYYRKHRFLSPVIDMHLGLDGEEWLTALNFAGALREHDKLSREELLSWWNGMTQEDRRKFVLATAELHECIRKIVEAQITALAVGEVGEPNEVKSLVSTPEIQFIIRVLVPCWAKCQMYPGELLRAARSGELLALEQLLAIDKSIVADPKIHEQIHQTASGSNKARFERIANAFRAPTIGRISLKSVKLLSAALVGQSAHELGHPLTEPQIRELFDSIAAIEGKLRDTDLPKSSEALSKALQRKKPEWAPMIRRTKVVAEMSG